MTSGIYDLPPDTTAGLDFNYAVWSNGTIVTLCNVPWNADYRDIVKFANGQADLDTYLTTQSGPIVTIENMTYAKVGQPVRVNVPFNQAFKYNYLRAANPAQPIAGDMPRSFYYFITDVRYVAPNTTEMQIQLDVWQTFGYGVTFGNCFIERGHIGIANENQFSDNGRTYLTVPEGLDIGGEYQIITQYKHTIASARDENYSILVTSTVSLNDDPGTIENPQLHSAKGSQLENLPNGAEMYIFSDLDHFTQFMEAFSDRPWITQGIVSITAIPKMSEYGIQAVSTIIEGVSVWEIDPGQLRRNKVPMRNNWRNELPMGDGNRYGLLQKFKVFPYTVLEMTSYTGTPLVLKPENWADSHATVVEVPHFASSGARIMFYPYRYNAANPGADPDIDFNYGTINDGGEFYDMATGIFNFPTFSLVNNGYIQYAAANTHGIAFQHASAEWSQQRALTGNQMSYDQATSGMELSEQLNRLGINAATQNTSLANETASWRALQGSINSGISGAAGGAKGGPVGAATGALTGVANQVASWAIEVNQNNQSLGIANNLSSSSNRATVEQQGYVRDTNKNYADYAARGDYQNQIAAINAKVQDARLIQPTTAGQVGGDAFNLATYKWGYDIKVKMLNAGAMRTIGEYWLRYGYQINMFGTMPASLMVMTKFTYWKLRETYITAAQCPETFKQAIRGIFEKGVTVWNNPADIGNIDIADNAIVAGIQL
jgi:hypothetical protein